MSAFQSSVGVEDVIKWHRHLGHVPIQSMSLYPVLDIKSDICWWKYEWEIWNLNIGLY